MRANTFAAWSAILASGSSTRVLINSSCSRLHTHALNDYSLIAKMHNFLGEKVIWLNIFFYNKALSDDVMSLFISICKLLVLEQYISMEVYVSSLYIIVLWILWDEIIIIISNYFAATYRQFQPLHFPQ